jgi:nicotinamide-nucleotide amidase
VCEPRTAVIISAGTELTEGIIQDSHVRYLSAELTGLGFAVLRGVQVPDAAALFRAELDRATRDAGLVVITGGLGPTSDDLTRELVAEAAGTGLQFHEEAWQRILERFRGRPISETNRTQATAPAGFPLIANPNGTAPGFHGKIGGALVVALPGPPSELRPMFASDVVPLLRERFSLGSEADGSILRGTAFMVPESALEEALRACRREGVRWGTRVDEDRIAFSLRGGTMADREAVLADLEARLGALRVRGGERRPADVLTEELLRKRATLVTAESCTGGLLGKYMTDLPGSSRVFWGGWVAYSYEAKRRLLGVETALLEAHGAVSREAVTAMARGALEASAAGMSLAVSGIAGPEGATPDKPVGTVWMACRVRGGADAARQLWFSGGRDAVRRKTAVAGLLFAESVLGSREFLDTLTKW